ncbi:hypothetical protein RB195_004997 [Necator americanus]|uniref:Uncharacterized protein n=1 Tax=Necator americanus TaxID=51031 RepID=A0ABR1BKP8_NECAM
MKLTLEERLGKTDDSNRLAKKLLEDLRPRHVNHSSSPLISCLVIGLSTFLLCPESLWSHSISSLNR